MTVRFLEGEGSWMAQGSSAPEFPISDSYYSFDALHLWPKGLKYWMKLIFSQVESSCLKIFMIFFKNLEYILFLSGFSFRHKWFTWQQRKGMRHLYFFWQFRSFNNIQIFVFSFASDLLNNIFQPLHCIEILRSISLQ